jgi:restriction system protein
MTANNIPEGYFVATGNYTEEALAFKTPNLHLLSGHDVLTRFNSLTTADHQKVVQHAFRGDFETPTCPSCDERMILKQTETPFWGCRNFPRCRKTFKIRERA